MWTLDDIRILFVMAGCPEDFCITEYDDKIVCGGWNRVYLYPDGTIKVSESHSRPSLLEVVHQLDIETV